MAAVAEAGREVAAPERDRGYTISDLATQFDVTARTLRYYEECGLLAPRRRGQQRLYSERDRVRLRLVLRGRRLGFSLNEIREMVDLYDVDLGERTQLRRTLQYGRARIAELRARRAELDATLAELEAWEQQLSEQLSALQVEREGLDDEHS